MPPGVPARLIIFVPSSKSLIKYASHFGIRTSINKTHIAVSMALVAFGKHPDHHPNVQNTLRNMFSRKLHPSVENKSVAQQIARFGAPGHVKSIKALAIACSNKNEDNNENARLSAAPKKQRKTIASPSKDDDDKDTQHPPTRRAQRAKIKPVN
ncbi:hypothetical protein O1611_g3842 [Lasiodiplodia mahajangana]|uniref:Uncharacterized protein n=1 Tax=Lasiodiplodia mahajangana TaxID=1108764 RepID=A0ACC2JRG7_9PEZI|nr:hypothetical protein O1611_g3842 [Lasiodiplodia mahajangana]